MNQSQLLTSVISVALLIVAVACKTTSPQSSEAEPTSTEATQDLEESSEETSEVQTDTEAEDSAGEAEQDDADAMQTVGVIDSDGASVKVKGHVPVVPGKVSVDGELEDRMVKRVMRKYRRGIQFCYKQSLEEQPDAGGKAVVESVVAADGSVESAELAESELPDTGLADCLLSKMKRWTYPETADGKSATVRIPWHFTAPETSD